MAGKVTVLSGMTAMYSSILLHRFKFHAAPAARGAVCCRMNESTLGQTSSASLINSWKREALSEDARQKAHCCSVGRSLFFRTHLPLSKGMVAPHAAHGQLHVVGAHLVLAFIDLQNILRKERDQTLDRVNAPPWLDPIFAAFHTRTPLVRYRSSAGRRGECPQRHLVGPAGC